LQTRKRFAFSAPYALTLRRRSQLSVQCGDNFLDLKTGAHDSKKHARWMGTGFPAVGKRKAFRVPIMLK
jgi:hypothetical protein